MKLIAEIITGKLTYVDTEYGCIDIYGSVDRQYKLDPKLKSWPDEIWKDLIGRDVEAVIINNNIVTGIEEKEKEIKREKS